MADNTIQKIDAFVMQTARELRLLGVQAVIRIVDSFEPYPAEGLWYVEGSVEGFRSCIYITLSDVDSGRRTPQSMAGEISGSIRSMRAAILSG